jgi:hypothetical protein
MVSPIDKNNGDIKTLVTFQSFGDALYQSSLDGEKFTYTSLRAFADPKAAPFASQYIASRKDGASWESQAISPPQGHPASGFANQYDANFKAFSTDLCSAWLTVDTEPSLDPRATEGYRQPYRRDNCGVGGYEALIGVPPTVETEAFNVEFQGASADGEKAILRVLDKLTPNATSGVWQTYYAADGELHLVCILPDGSPSTHNCSAGTDRVTYFQTSTEELGRLETVTNAISSDGGRVYWTDSALTSSGLPQKIGPRKIYLRLNPDREQSVVSGGKCTEAEKACTLKVSETASSKSAEFLDATADGTKALFEVSEGIQAGSLYLFDSQAGEAGESVLIAKEAVGGGGGEEVFSSGFLGASQDLSRVYLLSKEAIAGTSGATTGKPNLYLYEEGTMTFIATLSADDVRAKGIFSNASPLPIYHVARVSADGNQVAFISTEGLTGYDNTDRVTGEPDAEVYIYEAGSVGPVCVSCNPSGARPQGRIVKGSGSSAERLQAAAMIPPAQFMLHFPRSLSADGGHLFFNSYDALLPRDTNGKEDVYQWQAAAGEEECEEAGAELYVPSSGGCLSLISSGQSPQDSEFLDASANGDDAFFTTSASLLPQDPGLIDVYDAKAKGGLPAPPEPPGPCQGEACQIAPPPPNDPTPASASFKGAGNLHPTPHCRKGKVARKGRCVAKKPKATKRHAKRTSPNRGAGR